MRRLLTLQLHLKLSKESLLSVNILVYIEDFAVIHQRGLDRAKSLHFFLLGSDKISSKYKCARFKGAVIKYGTEGRGRDLTGSAKLLDGKCCASKIFQVISMDHEGICL